MPELFDPNTLFICTAMTTGVVAVAFTYTCFHSVRERAAIWWCLAAWCVTLGLTLVAIKAVLPAWLAVAIGNALVFLGYGLVFQSYRVFRDIRELPVVPWLGAIAWLALYGCSEEFRSHVSIRMVFASSIIAFYSALAAIEVWRGWKEDQLPSFVALLVLFATHAGVHAGRAVMALNISEVGVLYPVEPWLSLISLENFVHAIGISFFFFALSKERAERRYRLAAEIDSLTGAATRRFFVSETREGLGRAPKSGVLAIIDVDFFKSVNDCYGHLGGDRVLGAFGKYVNDRLEPGMVFGRLGGEEFGIFLPDMEASQARVWLEKLRSDVEALQIPFMGSPIRITISIGAASVRDAGVDFDHLMAAADGALYLAKEEGRNRLRIFNITMRLHQISEGGNDMRLGLTEQRLSRVNIRSRVGGSV